MWVAIRTFSHEQATGAQRRAQWGRKMRRKKRENITTRTVLFQSGESANRYAQHGVERERGRERDGPIGRDCVPDRVPHVTSDFGRKCVTSVHESRTCLHMHAAERYCCREGMEKRPYYFMFYDFIIGCIHKSWIHKKCWTRQGYSSLAGAMEVNPDDGRPFV